MGNMQTRLSKLETIIDDHQQLTEMDVELLLSCLPNDYADEVRKSLFEIVKEQQHANDCSNYRSQKSGWKPLFDILPDDIVKKVKSKIADREHFRRLT